MAGAALGEVQVSLFVAGAALGECLNVRLGAKCCNFQYKMLVVDVKSNPDLPIDPCFIRP